MPKRNVVIVGAGLFGSIAATLAREAGHNVTVVADARPFAASRASGCVLAPSWLSSLETAQVETAMSVLRQLYDVEELPLRSNLLKTFKAHRVNPDHVLVTPDVVGTVVELTARGVKLADGRALNGRVLLATGLWAQELAPDMPEVRGLWGASLRFKGQLDEPRIHVYAPYRQAVAFNLDRKTVWMGDGTALVQQTWAKESDARVDGTKARAQSLFGLSGKSTAAIGARPYVVGHKAGYFEQLTPNVWVSTGGAKNGTVLAAWQAHRFLTEALS